MIKTDTVVVVGFGGVNSLGIGADNFWPALVAGKSGASPITSFDASPYCTQIAYEVQDVPVRQRTPTGYLKMAVDEALNHAFYPGGLENVSLEEIPLERRGGYVASCTAYLPAAFRAAGIFFDSERGPLKVPPTLTPRMFLHHLSGYMALKFKLRGPTGVIDTACASGIEACVFSALRLLSGEADIMIAAGSDVFSELLLASFNRAGGLTNRSAGCRPFDRWRDGMSPGEGATAIVFMLEGMAKELGIEPLARLVGWASTNDAYKRTAPWPDGKVAAVTMTMALKMAGILPREVDYLNAHGTATLLNGPAETAGIKLTFGEFAPKLRVGSTKGATGHLMGGAGVLEAVLCVLAIIKNIIPGTTGLVQRDLKGGCDLNYVRRAIKALVRVAATNSFGFGGHNGCLVFTEV